MTYNEWCEYAQFGQACDYNFQINQFVERYNNAKHQQFINQYQDDRTNRSVQGVTSFWQERRDVLPTYGHGSDSSAELFKRPNYKEIHSAMQGWPSNVMG
jgi:hypothetical protein